MALGDIYQSLLHCIDSFERIVATTSVHIETSQLRERVLVLESRIAEIANALTVLNIKNREIAKIEEPIVERVYKVRKKRIIRDEIVQQEKKIEEIKEHKRGIGYYRE